MIKYVFWCAGRDSNPQAFWARDFKSLVYTKFHHPRILAIMSYSAEQTNPDLSGCLQGERRNNGSLSENFATWLQNFTEAVVNSDVEARTSNALVCQLLQSCA